MVDPCHLTTLFSVKFEKTLNKVSVNIFTCRWTSLVRNKWSQLVRIRACLIDSMSAFLSSQTSLLEGEDIKQ